MSYSNFIIRINNIVTISLLSGSGRGLRPEFEQRSCRSAIPAKMSAEWQKECHSARYCRAFCHPRLRSGL